MRELDPSTLTPILSAKCEGQIFRLYLLPRPTLDDTLDYALHGHGVGDVTLQNLSQLLLPQMGRGSLASG